jgi:hypothetical protein
MVWTVARITAEPDIWQGLPVAAMAMANAEAVPPIGAGRGVYALDIATGRAWTKGKPLAVAGGLRLFGCMIGQG